MDEKIKVSIFGAGSIGCYLGGLLLNAGQNVSFIGRAKFRTALTENGLVLSHFERPTVILNPDIINYSLQPASISDADVILITVKSQDTETAATSILKFGKPDALVISFQNGVNNVDVLRKILPNHKVLGGVVPFNVTSMSPGHFHCGTDGNLSIEAGDPKSLYLSHAFSKSGQGVDIYDDILAVQWGKLLVNLNNALNALTGGTLKAGLLQRDYRRALAETIKEALNIIRNTGIEPADFGNASADKMVKILNLPNFIYKIIMNMIVKIDNNARSSMLDDLEMGRVSEVEYLQGEIVRLAQKTGQAAPHNQKILDLINTAFSRGVSPKLTGSQICLELGI